MQYITTKLLLFLLGTISIRAGAQVHSESLVHLYQDVTESLSTYTADRSSSRLNLDKLFNSKTFHIPDYKTEIVAEKLAISSKEWGLNFLSSYVRNFGQGFSSETENFTQDRFAMELQWNLLSNGYLHGKIKHKIAANNLKIRQLEEQQYLKERAYGYQYNSIIYLFNAAKINYLNSRLTNLQKQDSIYYSLYLDHLIPYLEVLKVRKMTARYALLLGDYKDFNREFELIYQQSSVKLNAHRLPVYKVLIDNLIDEAYSEETSNQMVAYTNENVLLNEQLHRDIRFKIFARRTYTTGAPDGFQRNYSSWGIGLNIPINSLMQSRKKLTSLQVSQNTADEEYRAYHLRKELMNHYYEYEYKLQQYQQMNYEAHRLDEIIRKDQLLAKDTAFHVSRLHSLELLNERGEIALELISIKEQLYLKLLKIQSLSYTQNMIEYLIEVDQFQEKKLMGDRTVVIKAQDLNSWGYDLIVSYLRNSEIKKVITKGLPEKTSELFVRDGFQITTGKDTDILEAIPSDFESKSAMELHLRDWMNRTGKNQVLFTDLSGLMMLEIETINKQQQ